jgi:hypothetical protein
MLKFGLMLFVKDKMALLLGESSLFGYGYVPYLFKLKCSMKQWIFWQPDKRSIYFMISDSASLSMKAKTKILDGNMKVGSGNRIHGPKSLQDNPKLIGRIGFERDLRV